MLKRVSISRNQGLTGDSNTHYFFSVMKQRFNTNKIRTIYDEDDNLPTDPEEVKVEITNFYKKLLGSCATDLQNVDGRTMAQGKHLSQDSKDFLINPITYQEIDQAMFSIDDTKSPGI